MNAKEMNAEENSDDNFFTKWMTASVSSFNKRNVQF